MTAPPVTTIRCTSGSAWSKLTGGPPRCLAPPASVGEPRHHGSQDASRDSSAQGRNLVGAQQTDLAAGKPTDALASQSLIDIMGDQQHGGAARRRKGEGQDLMGLIRVEPDRRLVENQQVWPAQQGAR